MPQITSREQFLEYHRQYGRYLLQAELDADLLTPVLIGALLQAPFIFESVEQRGKWSRYTFLGLERGREYRLQAGRLFVDGREQPQTDPREFFNRLLHPRFEQVDPDLPDFSGGFIGQIGYDAVRLFEDIPEHARNQLDLPDIHLFECRRLLVIDNWNASLRILYSLEEESEYDRAHADLQTCIDQLRNGRLLRGRAPEARLDVEQLFDRDQFMDSVRRIKQDIFSGEIIQAVLSQRLRVQADIEPYSLYRALRRVNPSPYTFFMNMQGYHLIGASPEMHLKIKDGTACLRPIAGTRRIDPDPARNREIEAELRADPKEISEHVMLVDLARNDLGRFCEVGSVRVTELMNVEHYSHVMHMVSNVRGRIRRTPEQPGLMDMLADTFPAGTVSGAPKIRAMQIIAEHENLARNIYSGVVGYFDYHGNMDTAIAIRTVQNPAPGEYLVQAGAGVVAESDPQSEYEECHNKAAALLRALELAGSIEPLRPET